MKEYTEEQIEWNKKAYGFIDINYFFGQVRKNHKWESKQNAYLNGAISKLSDAQELLESVAKHLAYDGDTERVRQIINVAKTLIMESQIEERDVTPSEYAKAVKKMTDRPSCPSIGLKVCE